MFILIRIKVRFFIALPTRYLDFGLRDSFIATPSGYPPVAAAESAAAVSSITVTWLTWVLFIFILAFWPGTLVANSDPAKSPAVPHPSLDFLKKKREMCLHQRLWLFGFRKLIWKVALKCNLLVDECVVVQRGVLCGL